jgi:hypothetical protein
MVLNHAVVDLVWDNGFLKVIEFNPFSTSSGACLFSWVEDHDILYGKSQFEFRIE